jgi:hypothetical protein
MTSPWRCIGIKSRFRDDPYPDQQEHFGRLSVAISPDLWKGSPARWSVVNVRARFTRLLAPGGGLLRRQRGARVGPEGNANPLGMRNFEMIDIIR